MGKTSFEIVDFIKSIGAWKDGSDHTDFDIIRVVPFSDILPLSLAFAQSLSEEQAEQASGVQNLFLLAPINSPKVKCPHAIVENPRFVFGRIVQQFFNKDWYYRGISPTRIMDPSVQLGCDVSVGHFSVIGPRVVLGDRCVVCDNVTIGPDVRIGEDTVIKSGSIIGQPGFGTDKFPDGNNFYMPHIGSCIIGRNVWIGALNTVASGTINPTIIEDYVMTDDHVHIGHNAVIGENTIIAASTEISGSTVIGSNVRIGPNNSIMNKIRIGDRVITGLGSVIRKSQPSDVVVAGSPARILRKRRPSD